MLSKILFCFECGITCLTSNPVTFQSCLVNVINMLVQTVGSVKDHIAFSISNGAANRIRCMNQECELEFDADDIKPFVTEE